MWQQPDVSGDIIKAKLDSIGSIEDKEQRKAGYQVMRDKNLLMTTRLFIGKSRDDASLLVMNDMKGNARIIMMVDDKGQPRLDFLDESGDVVYSLPESK